MRVVGCFPNILRIVLANDNGPLTSSQNLAGMISSVFTSTTNPLIIGA